MNWLRRLLRIGLTEAERDRLKGLYLMAYLADNPVAISGVLTLAGRDREFREWVQTLPREMREAAR